MTAETGMTPLERLVEIEAIRDLKARRDQAVDRKDWDAYAEMHSDDYVAMSIGPDPVRGGRAAADALDRHMAGVTTVHHSHSAVIEFEDRTHATGTWAMEDNLFWTRNGEKQWVRGFGIYHERYEKGADGKWRFTYRKLERTHAETSPGAQAYAHDVSGENLLMAMP